MRVHAKYLDRRSSYSVGSSSANITKRVQSLIHRMASAICVLHTVYSPICNMPTHVCVLSRGDTDWSVVRTLAGISEFGMLGRGSPWSKADRFAGHDYCISHDMTGE